MQLRLSTAEARQKRILAVHDISCVGRCSLTVALPMLSAAGLETSILPTSILSTHTGGFSGYTYRDLLPDIDPIIDHWHGLGLCFDGIFTGWLGTHLHIRKMHRLLDLFAQPDLRVMIDPVMGDNGRLYATLDGAYVQEMRRFCARAQLLLPNLTEAALLTGVPYPEGPISRQYVEDMLARLLDMGVESAVLTGVSLAPGRIGAAALTRDGALEYWDAGFIPGCWHGAGDVFASALLAADVNGWPLSDSLRFAVDFTARCIRRTRDAGTDERLGLQFEPELWRLAEAVRGDAQSHTDTTIQGGID